MPLNLNLSVSKTYQDISVLELEGTKYQVKKHTEATENHTEMVQGTIHITVNGQ